MSKERLQKLGQRQREAGIDCVALVPGPNMYYLTGLSLFMSERPIVACLPVAGRPAVLVPALEQGRAAAMAGDECDFIPYTDEEGAERAFQRLAESMGLSGKHIAVEQLHMRALELWALEAVAPGARFVALEEALPGLRIIKDRDEVEAMRQAIVMTEWALDRLIAEPIIGLTERQVANRLAQEMMTAGADRVGFIIVVAGPNGADPHRGPSDRPVQAGELLTIDCGVIYRGYPSDITRTWALGQVDRQLEEIYAAVQRANAAGKAAIRAGIAAQDVDRAARRAITEAGYGEYFVHRTGHGLGLEGHEPPYIVEGNTALLEAGMVFTVEPGIYVPGLGGVRIEDNVVVTDAGHDCLTSYPRDLISIQ